VRRLAFLLLLLSLISGRATAQVARLGEGWKLRAGDSLAWARPSYDDTGWLPVSAPAAWEQALGDYDGMGWYRLETSLPEGTDGQPVGLLLSTVGDAFEVYWNGERIAARGSLPPRFVEAVDPSLLLVPPSALAKGRGGRHLVALRVYNDYAWGGLIGPVQVGPYEVLANRRSPRDVVIGGMLAFFLGIGVYHLAFFARRRCARENLWFAALCACMSVYGATYSAPFAALVLPYANPYRLGQMAMMGAGPCLMALVYRLFDLRFRRGEWGMVAGFLAVFAAAMLVPLGTLAHMARWVDAMLVMFFAGVTARAVRAAAPHRPHTRLLMAGTAAFSLAMSYDLASEYGWVPLARVLPGVPGMFWVGYLVFVVAVGIATAGKWALSEATALVDPLTQLSRRHVFEDALRREVERVRRHGGAVGVVLVDLDHFKRINDTYGHPAGDRLLARVGRLLRLTARNADVASRYGGEEFAVLLCETGLPGAVAFAERFRQGLRETGFDVPGGTEHITASVGVAVGGGLVDAAALLEAADRALYGAKNGGRDRLMAVSLPGLEEVTVDGGEIRIRSA
jgi:diguanylate cyclase (GGDEF)-like protein